MTEEYWPGIMFKIENVSEALAWTEDDHVRVDTSKAPFIVVKNDTKFNCIQAADFLGLSVNYFKWKVAPKLAPAPENDRWGQWRCTYKDLAAYRKQRDKERDEGMQELMELEQELGLYD